MSTAQKAAKTIQGGADAKEKAAHAFILIAVRQNALLLLLEAAAVILVSIMDIKGGLLSWCKKFLIGRTRSQ